MAGEEGIVVRFLLGRSTPGALNPEGSIAQKKLNDKAIELSSNYFNILPDCLPPNKRGNNKLLDRFIQECTFGKVDNQDRKVSAFLNLVDQNRDAF